MTTSPTSPPAESQAQLGAHPPEIIHHHFSSETGAPFRLDGAQTNFDPLTALAAENHRLAMNATSEQKLAGLELALGDKNVLQICVLIVMTRDLQGAPNAERTSVINGLVRERETLVEEIISAVVRAERAGGAA